MRLYFIQKQFVIICLVIIVTQFGLGGSFKPKMNLPNRTPKRENGKGIDTSQRKVIVMIIDAMREDFLLYDENAAKHTRLPETEESFNGTRISIFKELREKYPSNTHLMPIASEDPTITNIRAKNILNGAI